MPKLVHLQTNLLHNFLVIFVIVSEGEVGS